MDYPEDLEEINEMLQCKSLVTFLAVYVKYFLERGKLEEFFRLIDKKK